MKTWRDEVSGLSREAVRKRTPNAPWPMTEEFCKKWLWWWRALPVFQKSWADEISPEIWKNSRGDMQVPPPRGGSMLKVLYLEGAMEEWLRTVEDHEWRARLKDRISSAHAGVSPAFGGIRPQIKEFTGAGFTCCSAESWEEITRRFRLYLEEQGYTGRRQSVYWQSPRNSSPGGKDDPTGQLERRSGWLEIFTAVEAVDRATLLHEHLSDSLRRAITTRLRGKNREN